LQLADSLADGMAIEVERCGFVGLGAGGGGGVVWFYFPKLIFSKRQ
jgi:hypothetical protein